MGSVSPPGRPVMVNVLRGELHAMGDAIQQLTTGFVLTLGDVSENFNNAMENVHQEALHVDPISVSVIRIQTVMGIGTIESVEIPVSPNGHHVKRHVPLGTTSVVTLGDMVAMTDAFPNITSKEATTNTVGTVTSAPLATISVQLIRAAPALLTS